MSINWPFETRSRTKLIYLSITSLNFFLSRRPGSYLLDLSYCQLDTFFLSFFYVSHVTVLNYIDQSRLIIKLSVIGY